MKVQGVEIPQAVTDDAVAYIKRGKCFRSNDVQRFIDEHPSINTLPWRPAGLAMRAADRIIQRLRRDGLIAPSDVSGARASTWRWRADELP